MGRQGRREGHRSGEVSGMGGGPCGAQEGHTWAQLLGILHHLDVVQSFCAQVKVLVLILRHRLFPSAAPRCARGKPGVMHGFVGQRPPEKTELFRAELHPTVCIPLRSSVQLLCKTLWQLACLPSARRGAMRAEVFSMDGPCTVELIAENQEAGCTNCAEARRLAARRGELGPGSRAPTVCCAFAGPFSTGCT